jgi:hypothetical protein
MVYQPEEYRYRHFYAAHLIQRHFRNYKKGEEAGNPFDADVDFWAQLIYDSREKRAAQTAEQRELLFSQLQLKYWQSLCRGIEANMTHKKPPRARKKAADSCLVKGTKVMHATRGAGEVMALDWNDKRGKPVLAQFENGEVHHYSMESAAKLEVVGKRNTSVAASARVPQLAAQPLGSSGPEPSPELVPPGSDRYNAMVRPRLSSRTQTSRPQQSSGTSTPRSQAPNTSSLGTSVNGNGETTNASITPFGSEPSPRYLASVKGVVGNARAVYSFDVHTPGSNEHTSGSKEMVSTMRGLGISPRQASGLTPRGTSGLLPNGPAQANGITPRSVIMATRIAGISPRATPTPTVLARGVSPRATALPLPSEYFPSTEWSSWSSPRGFGVPRLQENDPQLLPRQVSARATAMNTVLNTAPPRLPSPSRLPSPQRSGHQAINAGTVQQPMPAMMPVWPSSSLPDDSAGDEWSMPWL